MLITRESRGVLRAVFVALGRPAKGRIMMQWFAQNVAAPDFPIIAGIGQVEVPDLVDLFARRDGGRSRDSEEAKTAIFQDGAARKR